MVHGTPALTRLAFICIWEQFFGRLAGKGEAAAAASLRKHYFDTDGYTAWCGGVDLNMPGSYSGSQSQESWHRHVLRPSLEHMKRPVEQVIERLNLLVKSRYKQASLRLQSLEDCPARMWSKKLVAEGEAILQKPAFISTATATVHFRLLMG